MKAHSHKVTRTVVYRQTPVPSIPIFLIIQSLLLMPMSSILDSPAQAASRADMTETQKSFYSEMIHPILKVKIFEPLSTTTTLNESTYRQLNNLDYPYEPSP